MYLFNKRAFDNGFTLMETLIVFGVISVLVVLSVIVLDPADLIRQSRDSTRFSDLASIHRSLSLLQADQPAVELGSYNTIYLSLPDPAGATSTCPGHTLPALPDGWTYQCTHPDTYRNADGTGWLPINFGIFSGGPLMQILPVDPVNRAQNGLYYAYAVGSWHLAAGLESKRYSSGGRDDRTSITGNHPNSYEIVRDVNVIPAEINLHEPIATAVFGGGGASLPYVVTYAEVTIVGESPNLRAKLTGSIENSGGAPITERGFVWNSTSTPDPGNISPNESYSNHVTQTGSDLGTGTFQGEANGQEGATYYFRAFAKNDLGYAYGSESQFIIESGSVADACGGSLQLSHVGNTYNLVAIGEQCWFAENLNVGTMVAGGTTQGTNCENIQKYCYNDNDANCTDLGGLYAWDQAVCGVAQSQGICPSGWRIATDGDFMTLEENLGMSSDVLSNTGWRGSIGNRLKVGGDSGFEALMAGRYQTGGGPSAGFGLLDQSGIFWTSSESGSMAFYRQLDYSLSGVARGTFDKNYALSVRCVK